MSKLNYNPKTEQEISRLFAKGKYVFTVMDYKIIINNKSYQGSEQLNLTLQASQPDGRKTTIYDTIIIHDDWAWKLRHFACSVGLEHEYMNDLFDPQQALGKKGYALIGIRAADGSYPEKNIIQDYLITQSDLNAEPISGNDLNDDIPF